MRMQKAEFAKHLDFLKNGSFLSPKEEKNNKQQKQKYPLHPLIDPQQN